MPEWTKEQKKAIATEGRNLLVSAAAGSGKTAVLVERILRKLKRRENPANVTDLLVVTFTRAAAAEMRDRVQSAVRKAIATLPEWTEGWRSAERSEMLRHLKKQVLLMDQAEICTIDSFCAGIVRNHAQVIDLDPATRLAKEDEMALIRDSVAKELIEEEYQSENSSIGFLSEYLGTSKTKDHLEEEILQLYRFSRNTVDPEAALEGFLAPYRTGTLEELRSASWNLEQIKYEKKLLEGALEGAKELLRFALEPSGPSYVQNTALEDISLLESALKADSYAEIRQALEVRFPRIATKPRKLEIDPEIAEHAKVLRDGYKNLAAKAKADLEPSEEKILAELRTARPAAEELIRLVRLFGEKLALEKRKVRVMDFNDQEHFALDILTAGGKPSEIAESMVSDYEEILIDEYQDSNELQEAILTSFAKRDPDTNAPMNVFMVGDIKQSIYRFRQANPDIFNEKYRTYAFEAEAPQAEKVELAANFRSRPGVTDAVNFLFGKLMQEEVGGVAYSDRVALNPKGVFPETDLPVGNDTTILLTDPEEEESGLSADEAEAHLIAQEIRRLLDPETGIYVKKDDEHVRKASFRDIVILFRSLSKGEVFQDVLESYGIPVYMKKKAGFYQTFEVQFVLDLLTVIDNPLDEVALTSVLHSPIPGLSSGELAEVVAKEREQGKTSFYQALLRYAEEETDGTAGKLNRFFRLLERFRVLSAELNLTALLRVLYRETGLLLFVNALPGGEQRLGNLHELLEKAGEFERTSLKGVFNFVRYVAKSLERSDEGEVGSAGENEDLVRIMTIHGSKGLEFPIVFVSGLGHRFNKKDENEAVIHHARLGVGLRVVDAKRRTENKTPYFRTAVKTAMDLDGLGEELRVLYVAMTRAREKLYLTGFLKDSEKAMGAFRDSVLHGPARVSMGDLLSSDCFLDWILKAYRKGAPIRFEAVKRASELEGAAVGQAVKEERTREELSLDLGRPVSPEASRKLDGLLGFSPHYDDLSGIYATLSVSAVKQAMMPKTERHAQDLPVVKDDTKMSGAERGTLYHRVLERIDPSKDPALSLAELRKEGLISDSEQGTIEAGDFRAFLDSDLGRRFAKAYAAGKCRREQQFIIGRPVEELYPEAKIRDGGELLMIQGVIDLWFEEDDGVVVVDYKTDRVSDPAILASEYRVQLDLYEKALTMMTGKPVKEKWIYSFALRKGIRI